MRDESQTSLGMRTPRPSTPAPFVSASEARMRDVILDRVCDLIDDEKVTYSSLWRHYKTIRQRMYGRLERREYWHFSLKTALILAEAAGVGVSPSIETGGNIRVAIR